MVASTWREGAGDLEEQALVEADGFEWIDDRRCPGGAGTFRGEGPEALEDGEDADGGGCLFRGEGALVSDDEFRLCLRLGVWLRG
jgi:hypothetical protein